MKTANGVFGRFSIAANWRFPAFDRLGIIGGKAGLAAF